MILFHFTMPNKEICRERELYFRVKEDSPDTAEFSEPTSIIYMNKGSTVTFDTYFNCFSYSRYKKYTSIPAVTVSLMLLGSSTVRLYARRTCEVAPELLTEKTVMHDVAKTVELSHTLENEHGDGFYYVEITALSEDCVFSGGWYEAEPEIEREIRIAAAVCSYRHENFVYKNAAMLGKYLKEHEEVRDKLWMLIVDNGQTLERKKLDCENAILYYNRNLGGSGGFTRGLMEASRSPEGFSHICMMDDDIRFDPEILYKTLRFLQIIKDEYAEASIGGTMLELEYPYLQYEMGGIWTGRKVINVSTDYDVRKTTDILANEEEEQVDYNAWWYMCTPLSFVEKHGLPFPFFIKGDDIDYGLRTTNGIVLMNGIGVWHEGFYRKYNGALEYYIKRNEAILNALHRQRHGALIQALKLLTSCGKQLVFQRYQVVRFILLGYRDFLNGAVFFTETDGEKLNFELISQNIAMLDLEQLSEIMREEYKGKIFEGRQKKRPNRFIRLITLYSYLLPTRCFDYNHEYRILEIKNSHPVDFYKVKAVVQINSLMGRGFITTHDKREFCRLGLQIIKTSFKLLFGYRRAAKSYRDKLPQLTSFDFWTKQLELDSEYYSERR